MSAPMVVLRSSTHLLQHPDDDDLPEKRPFDVFRPVMNAARLLQPTGKERNKQNRAIRRGRWIYVRAYRSPQPVVEVYWYETLR